MKQIANSVVEAYNYIKGKGVIPLI